MTETTTDDVRDLFKLKESFIPRELLAYHRAFHDVTNLHARVGMGDVPDDVATTASWRDMGDALPNAEADLVKTVAEEYPDLVADALADYRGESA